MQLYILDYDPALAAQSLCDVHVRKMMMETMQLLQTHFAIHGYKHHWKPYNPNNRFRKSLENRDTYLWVIKYLSELEKEFRHRFDDKVPRYRSKLWDDVPFHLIGELDMDNISSDNFARSFNKHIIEIDDVVEAYRKYYHIKASEFKVPFEYTNRDKPEWLLN
jgi:hypothetical protein